jgi:hypothetical protein
VVLALIPDSYRVGVLVGATAGRRAGPTMAHPSGTTTTASAHTVRQQGEHRPEPSANVALLGGRRRGVRRSASGFHGLAVGGELCDLPIDAVGTRDSSLR